MENVMLNSIQTQIKIVDFGLSNVWSSSSPLRTHCGSPEYAAPELFVTGKHYGAEVDLWSLGIILYGMVMGQLPFVSSRCEYSSSQERRRQLVAKINKGLASAHRRALTGFSPEFRHVLNRLLAADATKRVTTKELLVHPWITEKGRRLVRKHPIKPLDPHWQAKIITEIGTLLQVEPRAIMSYIAHEPLGKVGGMFNILVHKHQLNQLSGDGITRTLPSLTMVEIPSVPKNLTAGPAPKVSTARLIQEKRPSTALKNLRTEFYTPRMEIEKKGIGSSLVKPKTSQNSTSRKVGNLCKNRPSTVQPTTSDKHAQCIDYRLIKSPNLRRRAYSAGITPKTTRQLSPPVEKPKLTLAAVPVIKVLTAPAESSRRDRETQSASKRGAVEVLKTAKKLPQTVVKQASTLVAAQRQKDVQIRVRTVDTDKARSQSAHMAGGKRPFTTSQVNRNLERSLRHPSAPPPAQKLPIFRNAEVNRPNTSNRAVSRQKKEVGPDQSRWEKSPLAFGDATVQTPRIPQKNNKKHVISDPIARSIAEYVANNAGQLYHFSWFNKK